MTDVAASVLVIVGAAVALLGMYVLFRVVRRVLRLRGGRCARCGYVLIEGMRDRCPECGVGRPLRRRTMRTVAQMGAVVLLLAIAVFVGTLPWSIGWLTDDGDRLPMWALVRLYPHTTLDTSLGEGMRERILANCAGDVAVADARTLVRQAAGAHAGEMSPDTKWKERYGELLMALGRRYAMHDLVGAGAARLPFVPKIEHYEERAGCMRLELLLDHWLPTANPVGFRITSMERYGEIIWLEEGAYLSGCGIAPAEDRYVLDVGWVDEAGAFHVLRTVQWKPPAKQANEQARRALYERLPYEREDSIVEEGLIFDVVAEKEFPAYIDPRGLSAHSSWSNVSRIRAKVELSGADRNFLSGTCAMLQIELIDPNGVVRGLGEMSVADRWWRRSRAFMLPTDVEVDDRWRLHVHNAHAYIELVTPRCDYMEIDFTVAGADAQ